MFISHYTNDIKRLNKKDFRKLISKNDSLIKEDEDVEIEWAVSVLSLWFIISNGVYIC